MWSASPSTLLHFSYLRVEPHSANVDTINSLRYPCSLRKETNSFPGGSMSFSLFSVGGEVRILERGLCSRAQRVHGFEEPWPSRRGPLQRAEVKAGRNRVVPRSRGCQRSPAGILPHSRESCFGSGRDVLSTGAFFPAYFPPTSFPVEKRKTSSTVQSPEFLP